MDPVGHNLSGTRHGALRRNAVALSIGVSCEHGGPLHGSSPLTAASYRQADAYLAQFADTGVEIAGPNCNKNPLHPSANLSNA